MGRDGQSGYLILEDGRIFQGRFHGPAIETSPPIGEVVFNTAMSGYQEVLYDPSYWGQIVIMIMPHIGNTGINKLDNESRKIHLTGFAARSFEEPSNWRSEGSLSELLAQAGIPMFEDLDTRALTRHLRDRGSLRGGFFPDSVKVDDAIQAVKNHPMMAGLDGASRVACEKAYAWDKGTETEWAGECDILRPDKYFRVAVIDYGVKQNILRRLVDTGCTVKVFPFKSEVAVIEEFKPDGILLSNGPGDPSAVSGAVEKIQHFIGKTPILGICLGHQLLALANGGKTYKMKFGHRGINHPVGLDPAGRVMVSVHNHGFAVADDPLPDGAVLTLRSLNDNTVEGLEYPDRVAFSVQFHPEASPGPHDASDLFLKFRTMMEQYARTN
jgi:carbamoyl-phosphate synthase small subunit